jgi:predicted nucleic acid-binding protein
VQEVEIVQGVPRNVSQSRRRAVETAGYENKACLRRLIQAAKAAFVPVARAFTRRVGSDNRGLAALDALHLAAAQAVGATEFVTTEKPDKPLHRTTLIGTVSIHPA